MANVKCDKIECLYNSDCSCTAENIVLESGVFSDLSCETYPYSHKLDDCPNCGSWEVELVHLRNPFAYWDGAIRGEKKWTALCHHCGLNISDEYVDRVVKSWNNIPKRKVD
jgi:hypothetical protein